MSRDSDLPSLVFLLSRRDSCNDDEHEDWDDDDDDDGNGDDDNDNDDDDDDLWGITLFSLFPNTKSHMCT